jgi:mannose-6-phosphate isomerase
LCALTTFEMLAGMRTTADAAALLSALAVAELEPLAADLAAADGPGVLTEVLARILTWPAGQKAALVAAVTAACARLGAADGPYAAACAATVRIAAHHPEDLGVVASLLLRHAVLRPGQAVFLPAGGLHAYLHGTGIEHRDRTARELGQRGAGGPDWQAHRRARAAQAHRPRDERAGHRAARAQ